MDIRILILDDKINTAAMEILKAISPLVPEDVVFNLSGKSPLTVKLRAVDRIEAKLIFVCNSVNSVTQVKRQLENGSFEGEFDLVLLDDHWGETANEQFAGQKLLLEPTLQHIKGRNGEEPLVCLWTQHWEQDFRTGLFAETLRRSPYRGKHKMVGLAKANYAGLLLLVQEVIAVSELKVRNAEFEARLIGTKARIARRLGLLNSQKFRDKVVTPELFTDLAEAVEPFFQWKAGAYETMPPNLRPNFPVGIVLEGNDPVFINAVSEGLVEALTDRRLFLSSGFPIRTEEERDQYPREPWELLSQTVSDFYSFTADEGVVVIRADDIEALTELEDHERDHGPSMAQHLGSLLLSAFQINKQRPVDNPDLASRIKSAFLNRQGDTSSEVDLDEQLPLPGKVLWLFRRVGKQRLKGLLDSVAEMLPKAIAVNFSTNRTIRRRVLVDYARKRDCDFAEDALEFAVEHTQNLSFGQLIGDVRWFSGSFLAMAEQKAKIRANVIYQESGGNGGHPINARITKDIVIELLAELDSVSTGAVEAPLAANVPVVDNNVQAANGNGRHEIKRKQRLNDAESKLDTYEQLAQAITKERSIKTRQLGSAITSKLGIKPNNISQFARSYEQELRFLFNQPENADRWPCIRLMKTFSRLINQPISLLQ